MSVILFSPPKHIAYSHLFNKRGGDAKVAKSINVEAGKKLVHKSNKCGVEGGKI